jgi:hypothetical protein
MADLRVMMQSLSLRFCAPSRATARSRLCSSPSGGWMRMPTECGRLRLPYCWLCRGICRVAFRNFRFACCLDGAHYFPNDGLNLMIHSIALFVQIVSIPQTHHGCPKTLSWQSLCFPFRPHPPLPRPPVGTWSTTTPARGLRPRRAASTWGRQRPAPPQCRGWAPYRSRSPWMSHRAPRLIVSR